MQNLKTWAEIDLSALEHNFKILKNLLRPNTKALAVCKADAYGHGMIEIAKKLEECGADMLAVARVEEGVRLRENNIKTPILCLGEAEPDLAELIVKNNITQAIGDLNIAKKLSQNALILGAKIKVHIKIDTGMGRIGFYWPDNVDNKNFNSENNIAQLANLKGLEIDGMFSHFANAEGDKNYTLRQINKFKEAKNFLEKNGLNLNICHIAASDGAILYPDAHFNMVRFGIVLYGYASTVSGNENSNLNLKPVMTLKSRISAVRELPAKTKIGYGCTAELERNSVIAVLQTGYADGLPRILSNNYSIKIHNKMCKIIGRICMDMCMVDITDLVKSGDKINVGDEAIIYDGDLIVNAARNANTVIHEILCLCNAPRIKRVFIN